MKAFPPPSPDKLMNSFYREERETAGKFIAGSRDRPGTHLAIIGEAYSGRELFVRQVRHELGDPVTHISFSSPACGEDAFPSCPPGTPVVVSNAHYLATRTIGGFAPLDAFMSLVAKRKHTIVSSWNPCAWDYYAAVLGLDATCTVTIRLPPVPMEQLRDAMRSHYQNSISFVNDATLKKSVLTTPGSRTVRLPFTKKEIKIPWISIDWNLVKSAFARQEKDISPEDVVFSRLTGIAGGNPGIALALWNQSLSGPEIRVSRIGDPAALPDFSVDERFLLANLAMMESLEPDDLVRISGSPAAERDIFRLLTENVLEDAGGPLRIPPLRIQPVLSHLRKFRIVS